jgi:hypothetical protein
LEDPFKDMPDVKTQIEARELRSQFIRSKLAKKDRTPFSRHFPQELDEINKLALKRFNQRIPKQDKIPIPKPKKSKPIKIIKDIDTGKTEEIVSSSGLVQLQKQVEKQVSEFNLMSPEQLRKELNKIIVIEDPQVKLGGQQMGLFVDEPIVDVKLIMGSRFVEKDIAASKIKPLTIGGVPEIKEQSSAITKELDRVLQSNVVSQKVFQSPREKQIVTPRLVQPQIQAVSPRLRQPQIESQAIKQALKQAQPKPLRQVFKIPRPPRFPRIKIPREEIIIPKIPPRTPPRRSRPTRKRRRIILKRVRQVVPKFKGFPVLVRRRGIFRVAGFGRTPRQAVGIGKDIVGKTLAATFKVPSFKGGLVKGFRKKKEKGIFVFIEPRKQRLSTRSETTEIQKFLKQSMKGGGR